MDFLYHFQKLCHVETRRSILAVGIVLAIVLVYQSSTLPDGNALFSLFSFGKSSLSIGRNSSLVENSTMVGNNSKSMNSSIVLERLNNTEVSVLGNNDNLTNGTKGMDESLKNDFEQPIRGNSSVNDTLNENVVVVDDHGTGLGNGTIQDTGYSGDKAREPEAALAPKQVNGLDENSSVGSGQRSDSGFTLGNVGAPEVSVLSIPPAVSPTLSLNSMTLSNSSVGSGQRSDSGFTLGNVGAPEVSVLSIPPAVSPILSLNSMTLPNFSAGISQISDSGFTVGNVGAPEISVLSIPPAVSPTLSLSGMTVPRDVEINSSTSEEKHATPMPSANENSLQSSTSSVTSDINLTKIHQANIRKGWAPRTSLKPQWPSKCDDELVYAKTQIKNSPILKEDKDLYPGVYRNFSRFKRSYEMMERTLKVYIYKEGEKPIFHEKTQPILKGIYASEGWFMKVMEDNKKFVVSDPKKAHLFYMPFSSCMLQLTLYVRDSHKRNNLADYLKKYVDMLATKYPFWNRTGGRDHFLVACHDWAPFETRHHMDNCIKVLCNTNAARDFKIGKDLTLPEAQIRKVEDPLRDLGGKPSSKRSILAFFAGQMHGYLRPILLRYWKNDPDMKIYGEIPRLNNKMNYAQHMKSSKYCICARGYEVNSPRVVEAIFYECVPVIISDNYVPPFFEVLDWEAFAVFVAEDDIPKLKDILLAIPEKKYREMHKRVKKLQQHFLWHSKPVKYDIFHMILHSVWFSRLNQIQV
ncbi:hypothetical protein MKX03_002697 [Papaver bracteatum]|nr:hypothetical protein MKX03_002697 [Papaver bracteatum]